MEKNYDYYDGVLSMTYALSDYREQIDYAFINGGRKFGRYGLCLKNNKKGTLDEFGNWSFLNTINTHRRAFMYICQLYETFTKKELDFSTREKRIETFKLIKFFLEENYELFFTTNITYEYYNQFELLCNKSWMGGVIDTIIFLTFVQKLFPDAKIKEIIWDADRGNPDDFAGIDARIIFVTGFQKTIQIKRCSSSEVTKDEYILEGAHNGFDKEVDFYVYIKINLNEHYNEVFLFPHNKSFMFNNHKVIIPINKMKTYKDSNVLLSETLIKMLSFCSENKIIFNVTKEGEKNQVTFTSNPRNEVNVVISDYKDENLGELLTNKFSELKEFFK